MEFYLIFFIWPKMSYYDFSACEKAFLIKYRKYIIIDYLVDASRVISITACKTVIHVFVFKNKKDREDYYIDRLVFILSACFWVVCP